MTTDSDEDRTDPTLEVLVNIANKVTDRQSVPKVPVTLLVNGTVVTGDLIPSWQYMEDVLRPSGATDAAEPGDEEDSGLDLWAKSQREAIARIEKNRGKTFAELTYDDVEEIRRAPRYVHLAQAQLVLGPMFVPTKGGVVMRVELARVDGWFVGRPTAGS